MPKIIVVERPGNSCRADKGECPHRDWLIDICVFPEYRICMYPGGPNVCPDPDTFPSNCPLQNDNTEALRLKIKLLKAKLMEKEEEDDHVPD